MSFRKSGAFTHIVAATVAVATTGPPVSTLHKSLQLLFEDRQCCKFIKGNSRDKIKYKRSLVKSLKKDYELSTD